MVGRVAGWVQKTERVGTYLFYLFWSRFSGPSSIRAARAQAWEGKDPGSVRVVFKNPRWERHLLRFLGLSGVGRVVGDEDLEETRVARLDGWTAWEAEERAAR